MSAPEPSAERVRRRRLQRLATLGVLAGLPAVVLAVTLLSRPPAPVGPPEGPAATDEDIERALAAVDPGYVGIEVCAECHTARAKVVKTTRHYLACRAAPEGVTAPGFTPERGHFASHTPGVRFDMSRAGGDFLVTRTEADGRGARPVEYRVGLVYGSASKHDEMYFAWQDDRLFHLPIAWLHPTQQWGQAHQTDAALPTHSSCLECHNTWVANVPGAIPNRYRREGMLLGVTCERCHGPGKEHVEYHRAHPDDRTSRAILHPGTLARDRLMDVCAQCHANAKRLGRPFSYKSGEPLGAHFHNAKPAHQEDDTTNQVRYLSESKCYQKRDTLTCTTCHDPHQPTSGAGGCAICHKPEKCPDQPRIPEAVRGDCVGCHMPSRVWTHAHLYHTSDDRYVSLAPRAEHRIGVYPEARAAVLLAWARTRTDAHARAEVGRLTEELLRHWTAVANERERVGRFKGALGACREALRIAPDPAVRKRFDEIAAKQSKLDALTAELQTVRSADEAAVLFEKMLEVNPNSVLATEELGVIYSRTGRRQKGIDLLQSVERLEPSDSYGVSQLAELALREGRTDDAVALCAKAHAINPTALTNLHLWGDALLKQERWSEAENQFRKVLRSDPAHVGGNRGLSEALRRLGNAADAVRFARRAAHYADEFDAEVLLTLADAYSAANRTADAREALGRALRAAERTRPDLAPTVRDRLRSVQ